MTTLITVLRPGASHWMWMYFDLDPEKLGKFDVVLFLGVLYYGHLEF